MENETTLAEYQENALTTCMDTCHNVGYMLLNLIAEVGEVAEKIVNASELRMRENLLIQHLKIFVEISKFYGLTAKKIRHDDYVLWPHADDLQGGSYDYSENDREAIKGELGDILWQLSGLCSVLGLELDEIAKGNLAKLASRQERGKIEGDGDNR